MCLMLLLFLLFTINSQDVNLGSVRTNSLAKEIGCSLVYGSKGETPSPAAAAKKADVTAKLMLPLKFPEHRKGNAKSGR